MDEDKVKARYEAMRAAAHKERVFYWKLIRIQKLFADDEPKKLAALRVFFGAIFFIDYEMIWQYIKGFMFEVGEEDGWISIDEPYDYQFFKELWQAYYDFMLDEEVRQLVSPTSPQNDAKPNNDATDEAPVNPTEMITDHMDMDMDGSIHPKLDTFRFGYLCALLEQHGITRNGKYCYKEKDKKRNWTVAGHLVKEVTKSFGIKIQGGGAAWSILCPFWGIPPESARRNSQYEGGDEERKSEINSIIAEALKSLPD